MNNLNYVAVSGYGWSGSGAVVDLLREFKDYKSLDVEFRLLKDPYGIVDLESFLVNNWDILRSDVAIRDFLWFTSILDKSGSRFSRIGENLSTRLYVDFKSETIKYIDNLTSLKYIGYSMIYNYNIPSVILFIRKVLRKLAVISINKIMYLSKPTQEKFEFETRQYIERIFKNFFIKNNIKTLVLDQAIPISNINATMKYFKNIKLIIVDRDPRDIYVDLIINKALVGADNNIEERPKRFVEYYNLQRSSIDLNDNILQIRFEDLVINYNKTVNVIKSFLGEDIFHINKYKYLKPEKSLKNICLWKSFKNQDEIDYIYSKLKYQCYDV
jgi:hypothetical protein